MQFQVLLHKNKNFLFISYRNLKKIILSHLFADVPQFLNMEYFLCVNIRSGYMKEKNSLSINKIRIFLLDRSKNVKSFSIPYLSHHALLTFPFSFGSKRNLFRVELEFCNKLFASWDENFFRKPKSVEQKNSLFFIFQLFVSFLGGGFEMSKIINELSFHGKRLNCHYFPPYLLFMFYFLALIK